MKIERSQTKSSSLTEKIEIIRDTPSSPKDPTPPSLQDETNPLHTLAELVERLEALEDIHISRSDVDETSENLSANRSSREKYMSQVDHYLNLFQKQSAILRRLSNKLN